MSRIAGRFMELGERGRAAFIPFVTAGDPDFETCASIIEKLPEMGADLIEIGVPFSDPMADGPSIQAASLRALNAGMSVPGVFELVRRFRRADDATPIVLMGYFNPIHAYGIDRFVTDASAAGVDGLITVDLPPEEDAVLRVPASVKGIDVVRLATPTSDEMRLRRIAKEASGFLYYVSVAGVTGTKSFAEADLQNSLRSLKRITQLPCAVGFGIRTAEQAKNVARFADAVVIGSAIVQRIAAAVTSEMPSASVIAETIGFCKMLADSVHAARQISVVG
ncbi:MAG: tryptophan synthase subunit alpha [Alphaproteobacteria bacterium]|nr:tryptophan synthase subunit alpha [Alphaproteobacteria bacterium]